MKKDQKQEIDELPKKYRPISAWGYVGYNILFSLPLIGLIAIIVFAVKEGVNVNKRNYALSYIISYVITVLVTTILYILIFVLLFNSDGGLVPELGVDDGVMHF